LGRNEIFRGNEGCRLIPGGRTASSRIGAGADCSDEAQFEEAMITVERRESDVKKTTISVLLFIIRGYRL
jgi:hypothetical protein